MTTDAAQSWLDERLTAAGITRTGPVTEARVRAWSTVLTAPTDQGPVWLKVTGPGSAFEPALHALIARVAPDRVPSPIAVEIERGWLLLADHGPTLSGLDGASLRAALMRVLPRYAELQRKLMSHVDEMLAAGVADMRPAVMPARFDEAVEAALGSDEERRALHALRPEFVSWCERLAGSPVPASVDHNDLHPNSVFAAGTRILDWGDAVVAHPFASMLVALQVAADDPALPRLRDAYLEPFTDLAPRTELVANLELACRVAKPARALVWDRAIRRDDTSPFALAPMETLLALRDRKWLSLGR